MKAEMWLFDVPLLPDKHSDELKRLVGAFVCNDDIISARRKTKIRKTSRPVVMLMLAEGV